MRSIVHVEGKAHREINALARKLTTTTGRKMSESEEDIVYDKPRNWDRSILITLA